MRAAGERTSPAGVIAITRAASREDPVLKAIRDAAVALASHEEEDDDA
jgi:hypothetical protein